MSQPPAHNSPCKPTNGTEWIFSHTHLWFRPLVMIFGDLRVIYDGFCEVITWKKKHARRNKIDHGCPCGTEFTLGWTPFRTDANNGFSMPSNLVYTSVMITPESFNFKVSGQIPDSNCKTRLWYWSFFACPDHTFHVNKWNCSVVSHKFRFRQDSTIWIVFGIKGMTTKTKDALHGLFKFGIQIVSGSALN